jgi:hypothetical protein
MNRNRAGYLLLFTAAASIALCQCLSAQSCAPPPGFIDRPHPALVDTNELAAHTEEITVNRPLAVVLSSAAKTDIKDAIRKAGDLPGVTGHYALNQLPFGSVGARRLVCLSDGATLEEQVLEMRKTDDSSVFRYIVWNYTSKQARPIEYGLGEFHHTALDNTHTHVVWTYSFKLKNDEFPGYLGGLGRVLFRWGFLDRQYAAMMRATLDAGKQAAEQAPAG